jgi:S1-C subfamily serine protease
LGTGFIVSPDGYILTNNHVVAGAQKIDVQLNDGRTFKAVVVGADSLSDVAVIRIVGAAVKNLPVVYLGNSDEINVGDWVAAVGNPFSLTSSVTSGIVSAVGRKIDDAASLYQNFIQTDAAINPGNSGGPLVDIQGAVIGINTLIFSKTGGFMGIGFAIPVNLARRVMEDLVYRGEVVRGWIGITVQRLERTARGGPARGAVVADVSSGQPAALAGIRRGDVIMSIGGKEVKGPNDVLTIVAELQPGQQVPVALLRDGKQLTTTLTVAARPPQSAPVK